MSVNNQLIKFGNTVVKVARSNLTKDKSNASRKLYDSLGYEFGFQNGVYSFNFFAEDYYKFIDKGVKGVGGNKADGSKWKVKTPNSPFKFKSKMPPLMVFNGWTIKKGIAPRDAKGRFIKRKSLLFAIQRAVYHQGIEATNFISKPLNKHFERLPDDITQAYNIELDTIINDILK